MSYLFKYFYNQVKNNQGESAMADKKPTNSYVHVCAAACLFVYAPHGYSAHESQKTPLEMEAKAVVT